MVIAGIIRPPPEIRAVADKTASFVAKNGRAFESRILNSEKGRTPKFAFLQDTSPFHAYYEDRIQFYQGGGEDNSNNNKGNDGDSSQQQEQQDSKKKDADAKLKAQQKQQKELKQQKQQQKASALDPIAKVLLDQRKKIRDEYERQQKELQEEEEEKKNQDGQQQQQPFVPPPTRMMVGVTPPPSLRFVNITAPHSLSTVQVETIKLVAQFTALDESKNFLQSLTIREWHNPLFAFLQPRHTHFAYFSALTDCYKDILYQSNNNNKENEKTPSLWPESPQQCLEWAAYRSEYERHVLERQGNASNDFNNDDAAGASIDWHDFVVVETIDFAMDEIVAPPPLPEPTTTTTAAAAAYPKDKDTDEAMDESDDDDDEPAIRVVPNYTPKIVSATQTDRSRTHVIDPITGKSVPVSDTTEHMRIQLLDPKWAQEKKKFQDKQKESNLVSGDAIASNISRLAADTDDAKRSWEEANRAQQPGPTMPPPPPPLPGVDPMGLPAPKRPRMDLPPPGAPPPGYPPAPGLAYPMPPSGMPPPGMPPPPPGMPPAPMGQPPFNPMAPPPPPEGLPPLPPPPPPPPPQSVAHPQKQTSAEDFVASLDGPTVTLEIAIPHDPGQMAWNFHGQHVSLRVDVRSTIKSIKEELRGHLNKIPTNKLQLKHVALGFLKDAATLAQLNLGPLANLEMVPKTRGGRK